jgi:hypothetical protein
MRIEFLNPERTIARVTRWRWWRRVAATLYRSERCSRHRTCMSPAVIGWRFQPSKSDDSLHNDWWSGSAKIERARRTIEDPWQPVEPVARLPEARLLATSDRR